MIDQETGLIFEGGKMFIYTIKKDGYALGSAVGKKNAVNRITKELEFWSVDHLAIWGKDKLGLPMATVKNGTMEEVYTIEEERR